ncbi:cytochrome C oxidase subunit II, periplasmic domain protein [Collimonas arenae]|uniref:Cytochrome C oxidase subunit II, periplasmic domain protein n=1 Tax=Collimonas arenae TaxID=279058 RepID=A0A127QK07_9BURK|nr:cupredoxin domain-containing protein [Collimonas arenae]AMP10316.1 cytochrome C oxidase subunit II, periplasmic domain protein [Collimonas arenae]
MNTNHKRRLLLAGALAGGLGGVAAAVGAQSQERVIKVVAKKFDFTPGEIHLKKNVPVTLEFTTQDVVMGFNLPDFALRTDIVPGTTSRLRFTPDKAGEFPFHCDVFCGSGHENMSGVIQVT